MISKNPILSTELTNEQSSAQNTFANDVLQSGSALYNTHSQTTPSDAKYKKTDYVTSSSVVSVQTVGQTEIEPIIPEATTKTAKQTKQEINTNLIDATPNDLGNSSHVAYQYAYKYISPIYDLPYSAKSYFSGKSYNKLSYVLKAEKIDANTNIIKVFDDKLMRDVKLERLDCQASYWLDLFNRDKKDNSSNLDFYDQKATFKTFDYLTYSINNSYIDDMFNDMYTAYNNIVKCNTDSNNIIKSFNECKMSSASAAIVFDGLKENEVNEIESKQENGMWVSKNPISVKLSSMTLTNDDLYFVTSSNINLDYDGTLHFYDNNEGTITAYSSSNNQINKTILVKSTFDKNQAIQLKNNEYINVVCRMVPETTNLNDFSIESIVEGIDKILPKKYKNYVYKLDFIAPKDIKSPNDILVISTSFTNKGNFTTKTQNNFGKFVDITDITTNKDADANNLIYAYGKICDNNRISVTILMNSVSFNYLGKSNEYVVSILVKDKFDSKLRLKLELDTTNIVFNKEKTNAAQPLQIDINNDGAYKPIFDFGKDGALLPEGKKIKFKIDESLNSCIQSINIESATSNYALCFPKVKLESLTSGYFVTLGKGKFIINYILNDENEVKTRYSDVIEVAQEPISHSLNLINLEKNDLNLSITVKINEPLSAAPVSIIAQYNTFVHLENEVGENAISNLKTSFYYDNDKWAEITLDCAVSLNNDKSIPIRVYWINYDNTIFYKDIVLGKENTVPSGRVIDPSPDYVDDLSQPIYSVNTINKVAAFIKISAGLSDAPFELTSKKLQVQSFTNKFKTDVLSKIGGMKLSLTQQKRIVAIENEVTEKFKKLKTNNVNLTASLNNAVENYLKSEGFEISKKTGALNELRPISLAYVSSIKNAISPSSFSSQVSSLSTPLHNFEKVKDLDNVIQWNIKPDIRTNSPQIKYTITENFGKIRNGCIYRKNEKNYDLNIEKNELFTGASKTSQIEIRITDNDVVYVTFDLDEILVANNGAPERMSIIDEKSIFIGGTLDGNRIEAKYVENCILDKKLGNLQIESLNENSLNVILGASGSRKRISLTFVISELNEIVDDVLINSNGYEFNANSGDSNNNIYEYHNITINFINININTNTISKYLNIYINNELLDFHNLPVKVSFNHSSSVYRYEFNDLGDYNEITSLVIYKVKMKSSDVINAKLFFNKRNYVNNISSEMFITLDDIINDFTREYIQKLSINKNITLYQKTKTIKGTKYTFKDIDYNINNTPYINITDRSAKQFLQLFDFLDSLHSIKQTFTLVNNNASEFKYNLVDSSIYKNTEDYEATELKFIFSIKFKFNASSEIQSQTEFWKLLETNTIYCISDYDVASVSYNNVFRETKQLNVNITVKFASLQDYSKINDNDNVLQIFSTKTLNKLSTTRFDELFYNEFMSNAKQLNLAKDKTYKFAFDISKLIYDSGTPQNSLFKKQLDITKISSLEKNYLNKWILTSTDNSTKDLTGLSANVCILLNNRFIQIATNIDLGSTFEFCYNDLYAKYGFISALAITDVYNNPLATFFINTAFSGYEQGKILANRIYKTPMILFDDANSQINGNGNYDNLLPNMLYYNDDQFGNISKEINNLENHLISIIDNKLHVVSIQKSDFDKIETNKDTITKKYYSIDQISSYDYDIIGYLYYFLCCAYLKKLGWNKLSDSEDLAYYLILLDNLSNSYQTFFEFLNEFKDKSFGLANNILEIETVDINYSITKITDFFEFFKEHYYDFIKIWEERVKAYEIIETVLNEYDQSLSLSELLDKYAQRAEIIDKNTIEKLYLVLTEKTEETSTSAKESAMSQIDGRIWDASTYHFIWKNVLDLIFGELFDLSIINDAIIQDICNYGLYPEIYVPEIENNEYVPYEISEDGVFKKCDKDGTKYKWSISNYPQYKYLVNNKNEIYGIARDFILNERSINKSTFKSKIVPNSKDTYGNNLLKYYVDNTGKLLYDHDSLQTEYVVNNLGKLKIAKTEYTGHDINISYEMIEDIAYMLNNWEDNFYKSRVNSNKISSRDEILTEVTAEDFTEATSGVYVMYDPAYDKYSNLDIKEELRWQGYSRRVQVTEQFVVSNWKVDCYLEKINNEYVPVNEIPQIKYEGKFISRRSFFYEMKLYKASADSYDMPVEITISREVGENKFETIEITKNFEDYWITDDKCNLVKMQKRSLIEAIRLQKMLTKLFISEMTKTFYMVYALEKFRNMENIVNKLIENWEGNSDNNDYKSFPCSTNISTFTLCKNYTPSTYADYRLIDFDVKGFTPDYNCLYKDMSYITGILTYSYQYYDRFSHTVKEYNSFEKSIVYLPSVNEDIKYHTQMPVNDDIVNFTINMSPVDSSSELGSASISIGHFDYGNDSKFAYVLVIPHDESIEPFGIYPWNINKKCLDDNETRAYPEKWSASTADLAGLQNIRDYNDISYYLKTDGDGWLNTMLIANNINEKVFNETTAPMLAYNYIPQEWNTMRVLGKKVSNDDLLKLDNETLTAREVLNRYVFPKNKILATTYETERTFALENSKEIAYLPQQRILESKLKFLSNNDLAKLRKSYSYASTITSIIDESNFLTTYDTTIENTNLSEINTYYVNCKCYTYNSTKQVIQYDKPSNSITSYICGTDTCTNESEFKYYIGESIDSFTVLDKTSQYTYISVIGNNGLDLTNNSYSEIQESKITCNNITYSLSYYDWKGDSYTQKGNISVNSVYWNKQIATTLSYFNAYFNVQSYILECLFSVPCNSYIIDNNIQSRSLLDVINEKAQNTYKFFLGSVSQWQIVQDNVKKINEMLEEIEESNNAKFNTMDDFALTKTVKSSSGNKISVQYSNGAEYEFENTVAGISYDNEILTKGITSTLHVSTKNGIAYEQVSYTGFEKTAYYYNLAKCPSVDYFYDGRIDRNKDEYKSFWTSSEIDAQNAWIMFFDKQMIKNNKKTCGAFVRPFIKVT